MPAYQPADDGGLYLSSYLRWIPRRTGSIWFHCLMFLMRHLARINPKGPEDLIPLRNKFQRLDARFVRLPKWAARQAVLANGVDCEWVRAEGCDEQRVMLYLHGGAFALRMPNTHAKFAAQLSRLLGARVLLPDYRLAPEHKFPAAPDDCVSAYRWLLEQGIAAKQIVVAGDSAGGNLALALLLRLKQEGLPQPAAALALSPATDVNFNLETYRTRAAFDPVLPAEKIHLFADAYVDVQHRKDPTASPLLGEYAGIAPILIQVGTNEILLDDSRCVAQRIHETGGRVMCEVWDDMPHVFPLLDGLKESAVAVANIGYFIAAQTGWPLRKVRRER